MPMSTGYPLPSPTSMERSTLLGIHAGVVTCPWHGWAYNVCTGKAVVPPVGLRVPTYPVKIEGDDVVVVLEWPDD